MILLRELVLLLSLFSLRSLASKASMAEIKILRTLTPPPPDWTGDPCLQNWTGVQCDSNGTIIALNVSSRNLSGPIPPELGDLTSLTSLNLSRNLLTGTIPPQLSNLPQLQILDLSKNNLTGPIPPQLGSLSSLATLALHMNALTGPIPSQLGQLRHLASLSLFWNNLSGQIPPELGDLANVTTLALQQNSLEGPIPPALGQMSKLINLGLFQNNLTGPIPPELFDPPNLAAISLSQNSLTGPIPQRAGALSSLRFFDVSQNFLNGSVPPGLARTLASGKGLTLHDDRSNMTLAVNVFSSVALNCVDLSPGKFYEVEQRDSQVCADFYPSLRCECERSRVIGVNGSCYCVSPLQVRLLFVFADRQRAVSGFTMNLSATLAQLARLMAVNVARLAPVSFTPSVAIQTVSFLFNVLPDQGTALEPNEVTRLVQALREQPSNVTVPGFNPGYLFLEASEPAGADPPSPLPQSALNSKKSWGFAKIAAIGLSVLTFLLAVAAVAAFLWPRHRRPSRPLAVRMLIPGTSIKSWTLAELSTATDCFSEERVLGRGGFGTVYRGELEGSPVAVKRLEAGMKQGHEEFVKEVEIIGSIHHRNLVNLQGYCIEGEERLLVYDFMPNGSLQDWLMKDAKDQLPWPACKRILLSTAGAIAYLHHACKDKIIHRDIKPANILLDSEFEACVSDFGLARSILVAHSHVATKVMGTFGFLDPEYAQTGQLNEKSDVYSFGVVMLMVVTNRHPVTGTEDRTWAGLVYAAFEANRENRLLELVAPHFKLAQDREEAKRILSIALLCVQRRSYLRPSMEQVAKMIGESASSRHSLSDASFAWSSESSSTSFSFDQNTSFDQHSHDHDLDLHSIDITVCSDLSF